MVPKNPAIKKSGIEENWRGEMLLLHLQGCHVFIYKKQFH